MVAMWAEKEFRNLRRMHSVGVPCPKPLMLRSHVLVMEFLGYRGAPADKVHAALTLAFLAMGGREGRIGASD